MSGLTEKPVSLNPIDFEDALRGLLSIPPPDKPKAEEEAQAKSAKKKGRIKVTALFVVTWIPFFTKYHSFVLA